MELKPDRLAGRSILRAIGRGGDGVNFQERMVVFPPKIVVGPVPRLPLELLVEEALRNIVTITDQTGDPVIKAQAIAFRGKLGVELLKLAKRVEAQSRG